MNRDRMTWNGKKASDLLPVEVAARKAATNGKKGSAHPAMPDEGIVHPAGYADPTQPSAYENGDTSSWAEDVHPGPYRTSPMPANPMDEGGYRHPAAQPGAPQKNAGDAHKASVRKASLCIRIASAMLGSKVAKAAEAGDKMAIDMVEDQAFDLMDMPNERIAATLRRIEAATEDEEVLLRKMLAGDEGAEEKDEEKDEEDGAKKEAGDSRLAEVMSALASLSAQVAALKGGGGEAPEVAGADDDEALLASMMAEEQAKMAGPDEDADAEAMLAQMLAEDQAPEAPKAGGKSLADYVTEIDSDVMLDPMGDPLGLSDDDSMMSGDDAEVLASLFASDMPKQAGEEEEEVEEEEEEEPAEESETDDEAKKKQARNASIVSRLDPKPKKAGATIGAARTLGTQVRTAGTQSSGLSDLEKLWASAPDVSDIFNR